jgi:signal transduction histidine kinase
LLLAVAAVYVVAGKLGLLLAFVHASASAVWPPTGIAIAAFLLFGTGMWPAILVGAFVVNVTTAGSIVSSLGIAVGNTLEGIAAMYLANRFAGGRHAFQRPGMLLRYAVLAAVAATMVSATIGVSTLVLTVSATTEQFAPIWMTWWLGDLGGALVVAPLLVLWLTRVPRLRHGGSRGELLALLGALVATALFVFGPVEPFGARAYPVAFLTFPVLVWAALRFGPRGAATAVAILSGIAVWGTLNGAGPFMRPTQNESLLLLQGFLGIASVTTLALAAALLQREQAEERMVEAEEALRRAEERKVAARDEFLSVAAHELKTPLASLQLAVDFLLRQADRGTPTDARALRRSLGAIGTQTMRLGQLISQLLDTVRIQTGRLELDISEQDVTALTAGVVQQAQATTGRHEIALVAPPGLAAAVDPLRYEQVVRNLLDNAIKYSPQGGRIEVELAVSDSRFQLAVRDHGVGVAPEHRAHMFDRFYQADPERQQEGLGLGLHVSRHIVELHGGRISAEFPADGGTRIVVHLPTAVASRERVLEEVR